VYFLEQVTMCCVRTLALGRGVAAFALVAHRLRWEQAAAGTV
jgi:hypothetical protein